MGASVLQLRDLPISTMGAFIEAAAIKPRASVDDLAGLAGFGLSTARKALSSLGSLGVIQRDGDGLYGLAVDGASRGMNAQAREQVVRRALLGYRPFQLLVEAVSLGEKKVEAVRRTLLILGLPPFNASKLHTLLRWGSDLGVVEMVNGEIQLAAEVAAPRIQATCTAET